MTRRGLWALGWLAIVWLGCVDASDSDEAASKNKAGRDGSMPTRPAADSAMPGAGEDEPHAIEDRDATSDATRGDGGPGADAAKDDGPDAAKDAGLGTAKDAGQAEQPDAGLCTAVPVASSSQTTLGPGNLLVLFDQSGSMQDSWPGTGTTKLVAARNALEAAVQSLQAELTVGALLFPTVACIAQLPPPPGGAVDPLTTPPQIPFMPAASFLADWRAYWSAATPMGIGTPLNEAFDRAAVALADANLSGPTLVVVFTDGAPNCFPATDTDGQQIAGIPTMPEPQRAAQWLTDLDITTHVVGLPGADGVNVLNAIAQSGGSMQYLLPDDPNQLEQALRTALQTAVMGAADPCVITLSSPVSNPDGLLLLVDQPGVGQWQVPADRGWTHNAATNQVEITGGLCQDVTAERLTDVRFRVGCSELPVFP